MRCLKMMLIILFLAIIIFFPSVSPAQQTEVEASAVFEPDTLEKGQTQPSGTPMPGQHHQIDTHKDTGFRRHHLSIYPVGYFEGGGFVNSDWYGANDYQFIFDLRHGSVVSFSYRFSASPHFDAVIECRRRNAYDRGINGPNLEQFRHRVAEAGLGLRYRFTSTSERYRPFVQVVVNLQRESWKIYGLQPYSDLKNDFIGSGCVLTLGADICFSDRISMPLEFSYEMGPRAKSPTYMDLGMETKDQPRLNVKSFITGISYSWSGIGSCRKANTVDSSSLNSVPFYRNHFSAGLFNIAWFANDRLHKRNYDYEQKHSGNKWQYRFSINKNTDFSAEYHWWKHEERTILCEPLDLSVSGIGIGCQYNFAYGRSWIKPYVAGSVHWLTMETISPAGHDTSGQWIGLKARGSGPGIGAKTGLEFRLTDRISIPIDIRCVAATPKVHFTGRSAVWYRTISGTAIYLTRVIDEYGVFDFSHFELTAGVTVGLWKAK